jgi:hypothetical protein
LPFSCLSFGPTATFNRRHTALGVQDLRSYEVGSAQECGLRCDEDPNCNIAAYFPDISSMPKVWHLSRNCLWPHAQCSRRYNMHAASARTHWRCKHRILARSTSPKPHLSTHDQLLRSSQLRATTTMKSVLRIRVSAVVRAGIQSSGQPLRAFTHTHPRVQEYTSSTICSRHPSAATFALEIFTLAIYT